ncbi:uncharacterized protein LOC128483427 [Spea bombifrons]|uniref:uncharacterized protein LOC128483427 n=1 Tax=Spea bombifrons TaxID=233779 RepID=UPI0023498C8E|nr:uncharacterized protein LOC128483427 [Spea bombifrons]
MRHPRATEWAPPEHIALYIHKWLRKPLSKEVRNKLRAECPRPCIPDKVALTPELDPNVVALLSASRYPRKGLEQGLKSAQDKILDLVGPITQILSLADKAYLQASPLDPKLVREWALRTVCLLGNANVAVATERRKAVLLRMDPRLAELGSKDLGAAANGMLFGDAFVKELNRHVSLLSSWNKAKLSMRKVFQPAPRFSSRAGRPRGRVASRYSFQGSRYPQQPQPSYRGAFQQRPFPQRGGSRGRASTGFPRGRSGFA